MFTTYLPNGVIRHLNRYPSSTSYPGYTILVREALDRASTDRIRVRLPHDVGWQEVAKVAPWLPAEIKLKITLLGG